MKAHLGAPPMNEGAPPMNEWAPPMNGREPPMNADRGKEISHILVLLVTPVAISDDLVPRYNLSAHAVSKKVEKGALQHDT